MIKPDYTLNTLEKKNNETTSLFNSLQVSNFDVQVMTHLI